ncbi:MAG: hypothetical protein LUD15_07130 [Bacteroides sp.]|nr:hypothetical protein [Bacteroides sp.]
MVFDNYNYFGVSTRNVRLLYRAGSTESISVDTNLDTYTAYWSNADGNIDEEAGSITLGEDFNDPDSIFQVAISDDGTVITVTALRPYDESFDLPEYITIIAGRLELTISITQGTPVYRGDTAINLYGPATGELGSLGNYVLGTTVAPNQRTRAYVAMLRETGNFGPGGRADIEGINISDLSSTTTSYPAVLLSLYDVLYCPYPYNPDPGTIIAWHEASSNRVLIAHYDNLSTNSDLMAALGVAYTYPVPSGQIQPYTLTTNAPDFITNGPFGVVDNTLQYRVYDNAFGRISLEEAAANNITPVLLTPDGGGIVLGVDKLNGIVYCGDIDLYNYQINSNPGITIPESGSLSNQAAVLLANLWAWIVNFVLLE